MGRMGGCSLLTLPLQTRGEDVLFLGVTRIDSLFCSFLGKNIVGNAKVCFCCSGPLAHAAGSRVSDAIREEETLILHGSPALRMAEDGTCCSSSLSDQCLDG